MTSVKCFILYVEEKLYCFRHQSQLYHVPFHIGNELLYRKSIQYLYCIKIYKKLVYEYLFIFIVELIRDYLNI